MQTPLPTKYPEEKTESQRDHNEIVDYLAELTAVVEELQSLAYPVAIDIQTDYKGYAKPKFTLTPNLKETLLGEIRKLFGECDEREDRVEISDVEAIINRVML